MGMGVGMHAWVQVGATAQDGQAGIGVGWWGGGHHRQVVPPGVGGGGGGQERVMQQGHGHYQA
jgi:hypothetical protein